ncbi:MAG: hypothetical protein ACYTHK_06880 [Planctomycetota bacterium]|jgi:hypothetical protein
MIRTLLLPLLFLAACATTAPQDSWPAMHAISGGPTEERAAIPKVGNPHRVNALAGYNTARAGGSFTVGGQYEYRLNPDLGVGGFLDLAWGDEFASVLGGGVFWHPIENLNILGAPGYDFNENELVVRVGASYDFDWEDYRVGPAVYVDLGGEGTPILLAFNFGWDF